MIKITGDSDYLAFVDEQIINKRRSDFVAKKIKKTGFYPEQGELDGFLNEQNSFLKKMGKQRFVKYFRDMFDEEVDIEVHVTDEKFNRVVAVQQLRETLTAYSKLPVASKLDVDAILREMFNIMGIKGEFFLEKPQLPAHAMGGDQGPRRLKEFAEEIPNEVTTFENANGLPQQQPVSLGQGLPPGLIG